MKESNLNQGQRGRQQFVIFLKDESPSLVYLYRHRSRLLILTSLIPLTRKT